MDTEGPSSGISTWCGIEQNLQTQQEGMGWSVLGNCISYSHGLMHLLGSKPLVAVGGGSFPATTLNSPEQSSWACKHVLGMEKILHLPPPCSWIMFRGCSNKGHFTRRGNSGSAHQWKRNIELQGLFFFLCSFPHLTLDTKRAAVLCLSL